MDTILIFVVLPLATIIFSIALQKLLKCPILVSAIIFAIFLILTYTTFGTDFIIFAILFAILAFITAYLVNFISRILTRLSTINTGEVCANNNDNTNTTCNDWSCSCNNNNNERVILNAEVLPAGNGNAGTFRGGFRRRRSC